MDNLDNSDKWVEKFFDHKSYPTRRKHEVLKDSVNSFLMSSSSSNLVFFDGYAGAGCFCLVQDLCNDTFGSPIIILNTVIIYFSSDMKNRGKSVPQVSFHFCEFRMNNYLKLVDSITQFLLNSNICFIEETRDVKCDDAHFILTELGWSIHIVHTSFYNGASRLLQWESISLNNLKVFSFIDPFGFEGLDFEALCRFLEVGNVLWFVATSAIRIKAISSNSTSVKQQSIMTKALGPSWTNLRNFLLENMSSCDAIALNEKVLRHLLTSVQSCRSTSTEESLAISVIPLANGVNHLILCSTVSESQSQS